MFHRWPGGSPAPALVPRASHRTSAAVVAPLLEPGNKQRLCAGQVGTSLYV